MPVPHTAQLRSMLITVLIAYGAFVVLVYLFGERVMFQPPPPSYTARRLPLIRIPVNGASLAAVYLPNSRARYTLIHSHGNAEDAGQNALSLQYVHDAGFAVVFYDYRGYGLSTGGPATAAKATEDLAAVYDYAVNVLHVPADRIILFGRSIGSGPTMELAARKPIAGVILESAFKSAFTVVTFLPILPFDRFRNLKHIRNLRVPVLVIHGVRDRIVPFRHGVKLYDAAPGPKQKLWVEQAGHNDVMYEAGDRYYAALRDFAKLVASTQHPR